MDPSHRILAVSLAVAFLGIALLARAMGKSRRWRDPQRLFDWDQKRQLIRQAGGQCEHKAPLWRRCPARGEHADHVVPWSRGGPTELWNGQLLCRRHNVSKSYWMPTRTYRWRLAQRRKKY